MPLPALELDPYSTLLGIKVSHRPLNPYELLNLQPLDGDRDRIRTALERQLLLLNRKRAGVDSETWVKLHDELQVAAATLLDPERRTVVDGAIKRKSALAAHRKHDDPLRPGSAATDAGAVACPVCQRANSAGRRFCGDCGQALWESCPQCSGEVALGERFCGQCGLDVRGRADEQKRQIEQRLDAAAALASEHRYDEAISTLHRVAAVTDPKLDSWAAKALAQVEQLELRRQQAVAAAQAATEQAKQLVTQQAFEQAAAILETIPPPLRDDVATELLSHAQFAGKELNSLLAEIRQAAQEGRIWGLFPKIERLLDLKPDHQAILKLADQLRAKLTAAARKRLAQHRYADAAQALAQVPPPMHTDESRDLFDRANELAALWSDLKQSPYATADGLALAQRLAKLVPANEEVAALARQLAGKCAAPPHDARLARPLWNAPQEQSAVGPPMEWLGHFVRTQAAGDRVSQTLRSHPGEFFLALGLALARIEESALNINLLPADKQGVLGRIAAIPILSRRATTAWGIDLGSHALKALKLSRDAGGNVKVEEAHYILLRKPLAHPETESQRPAILAAALTDLAGRTDLKGSHIAAALPSQQVLGRFFDLPPLPAKKVPSAVEYEARHQIPIDLTELCWGWTQLASNSKDAASAPLPVVVLAARRSHVEECAGIFATAGIRLDSLHSSGLALHHALWFEFDGSLASRPLAVLDVGAGATNFVVCSANAPWFRCFTPSGSNFTAAIVQEFQLTYNDAEAIKRQPAKAPRYHRLRAALQPLLAQLRGEIERSLASHRRQPRAEPIERIYILGGGANLHGLLRDCLSPARS